MGRLAVASTHLDLPSAYVARSLLDQHGIPAFLFDHHLGGMSWVYLPAMRGIRLMVREDDLDTARSVLTDPSHRINVEDDESCPACGSDDVFRAASWILGLASVFAIGPPILVRSRRRHCRACKHDWLSSEGFLV